MVKSEYVLTPGSLEIIKAVVDLECCRVFAVHNVRIVAVSLPCQIFRAETKIFAKRGENRESGGCNPPFCVCPKAEVCWRGSFLWESHAGVTMVRQGWIHDSWIYCATISHK